MTQTVEIPMSKNLLANILIYNETTINVGYETVSSRYIWASKWCSESMELGNSDLILCLMTSLCVKSRGPLGSITINKTSGADEIPAELFKILDDDAVKVLHSLCLHIWKTQQWPQDWKRSVFIPIPKKGNTKESSNYCTIALISYASKVILKILWAMLPEYVNWKRPDVQAGFRKGRGIRDQIANTRWIIQKARSFRKTSTSALLTTPKPLTVWITTNCVKFFKTWEYQATLPVSWETCMQVKK